MPFYISCLSLNNFTSCLIFFYTFFQLRQTLQLRVPSGPAGNAYIFFSLLKHFKHLLAVLIYCLLGNLLDGNTFFLPSSCSCKSVTLTFKSSLSTLGRLFGKRHAAFACLPQRPTGFLRPWMKASFAAAMAFSRFSWDTEGLLPLILATLNVIPLILPTFLHGHFLSLTL